MTSGLKLHQRRLKSDIRKDFFTKECSSTGTSSPERKMSKTRERGTERDSVVMELGRSG